jgi:hypothetical protein
MSRNIIERDQLFDDIPGGESGRDQFLSTVTGEIKTVSGAPTKVWTICRRYSELQLPRRLTLQQWAERDRLLSGDYVFDRNVDTWVCARDLSELKAFFRKRKARRAQRVAWAFLAIAAVTSFVAPIPASLFVVAVVAMVVLQCGRCFAR